MGIILAKGVWLLGTIAIAVLGFYLRNPMVASIRSELWWVGLGLGLLGLAIALFGVRRFPNQFQGYLGVAIASLNAGVDLILLAYDPSLYYPVLNALFHADKQGKLHPRKHGT